MILVLRSPTIDPTTCPTCRGPMRDPSFGRHQKLWRRACRDTACDTVTYSIIGPDRPERRATRLPFPQTFPFQGVTMPDPKTTTTTTTETTTPPPKRGDEPGEPPPNEPRRGNQPDPDADRDDRKPEQD